MRNGSRAVLVLVLVAACAGLESVRASEYDQSCSVDADCVLVNELAVENSQCSECNVGAVNAKDAPRMRDDVTEMRGECPQDAPSALCQAFDGRAGCVSGRCTVVPNAKPADAGVD
jgi:hypothetical protein